MANLGDIAFLAAVSALAERVHRDVDLVALFVEEMQPALKIIPDDPLRGLDPLFHVVGGSMESDHCDPVGGHEIGLEVSFSGLGVHGSNLRDNAELSLGLESLLQLSGDFGRFSAVDFGVAPRFRDEKSFSFLGGDGNAEGGL